MTSEINNYFQEEIKVLSNLDIEEIELVIRLLKNAIDEKRTIYCFGNGGSASTASHMANDFNKILKANCICLNDNIATIMAIANDISYDNIFSFQLERCLKPGDIIIAISGSGNSINILKAVIYANKQGNQVIGLTGFGGGALSMLSDYNLHVPINNMQITEDVHLMFNHLLVSVLLKFMS